MDQRGVTRPMAERLPEGEENQTEKDKRLAKLATHHENTLWIYWTLIIFGIWLMLSPLTFDYMNEKFWVDPSGGRGAWWSSETHTALRAQLMTASDILSGLILLIFSWRSLRPNRPVSLWICCGIGVWITMAPVFFWSPSVAAYFNDTIVGAFVIALSILIPGMPNMIMFMQMGGSLPKGWSYNPSSWPQRWVMIVLGFAGWMVSRYLTTFQLGYSEYVWDPFFGFEEGSQKVLNSSMSHAWPISDAGLGALSYTFEFLMGWMGGPGRWRTMPWMVTFFGILVIPLGITHIFLVISMPVMVGAWCFFCILAASIMLPMIPLQVDEVMAMLQHMFEAKKRGDQKGSLWKVFWLGGSAEGSQEDQRSPKLIDLPTQTGAVVKSSLWGFSLPWNLSVCALLGLAVMFIPLILGTPQTLSHIFHVAGALVITFAVIAMGEVIRICRLMNLPLALAIALGAWMVDTPTTLSMKVTGGIFGLLIVLCSLPRGIIREKYGPWDRFVL